MTLKLGVEPAYAWRNLSKLGADTDKSGVFIHMRPARYLDVTLAQTRARASICRFAEDSQFAARYGFETVDWAQMILDKEAQVFEGVGGILFATELAMIIGQAFRGVEEKAGKPAEYNRLNLTSVFMEFVPDQRPLPGFKRLDATFSDNFQHLALTPLKRAQDEGKP